MIKAALCWNKETLISLRAQKDMIDREGEELINKERSYMKGI